MEKLLITILLLASPAVVLAQSADPDSSKIVTADVERFWNAFDQAAPAFRAAPFQKLYLDPGSIGVEGFMAHRIISAERLAEKLREDSAYYASIREATGRIREMAPGIRAAFYAMEYVYPEAVYPDVYFVIGRRNSGGTASDSALIVGAEIYGQMLDKIPPLVAHELVHFQQNTPDTTCTLLCESIQEGSADFIGELIAGRHIYEDIHAYANPREMALWNDFSKRMHSDDFQGWLWSDAPEGRPHDLGYWMGYKITAAYYEQAENKHQAVADILEIEDYEAFLEESGYAEKFSE